MKRTTKKRTTTTVVRSYSLVEFDERLGIDVEHAGDHIYLEWMDCEGNEQRQLLEFFVSRRLVGEAGRKVTDEEVRLYESGLLPEGCISVASPLDSPGVRVVMDLPTTVEVDDG